MKCPKCHAANPEAVKFCGECGTALMRGHESDSPGFGVASPKSSEPGEQKIPVSVTKTMMAPADELLAGALFAGRCQVIEELGRGGMGSVYRVFDRKLKEEVALKLIKPEVAADKDTIERFGNDLRLARKRLAALT